jgi:hypothetical protein
MKQIVYILIATLLLISCNKNAKELKERITGADSVAINFFKGDGNMDTVVMVKIIRDSATIGHLVDLVTGSSAVMKKGCGTDGSLHFFKSDMVIQDIDFRMGDECSLFLFTMNGKRAASRFSVEARAFLNDIKLGKRK